MFRRGISNVYLPAQIWNLCIKLLTNGKSCKKSLQYFVNELNTPIWLLAKRGPYDELGAFVLLRVVRCRFDMERDMRQRSVSHCIRLMEK